jgi:hypothetical protein
MTRRSCFVLFAAGLALAAVEARAEEVRYYEQNGVTYRETRRVVEDRIPETKLQDCTRTVYREQVTCETKDVVRTYWLPVTEYHWQARWGNYGNPFAPAYQVLEYVPSTRWESRTECVKMPVECRRLVPEVQTVQTPVTTYRTVQREVLDRVAVSGLPGPWTTPQNATTVARREQVGGLSRFESDPPRYGLQPAWQPAGATR